MYVPVKKRTETVSNLQEEENTWHRKKKTVLTIIKKNYTLVFRLFLNSQRVRVCKKFSLNALDIGVWSVRNWVSKGPINATVVEDLISSTSQSRFNRRETLTSESPSSIF